ncbi:hypothetical protein HXX76_012381 [Chlamydomonas incerta]|uniref:Protein kinase domain-containing protein n=1 Tax=Chlamydomonas incerta TaxID=51695 RepID=A0A835SVQ1_CHLIN|nr:hypothetical protein HXX76_012381 [Chlamydomonas incerta]|eukprot:KAG2427445.1 hypothetical protein HXX76_012381 [Chlamydomonas incerta]
MVDTDLKHLFSSHRHQRGSQDHLGHHQSHHQGRPTRKEPQGEAGPLPPALPALLAPPTGGRLRDCAADGGAEPTAAISAANGAAAAPAAADSARAAAAAAAATPPPPASRCNGSFRVMRFSFGRKVAAAAEAQITDHTGGGPKSPTESLPSSTPGSPPLSPLAAVGGMCGGSSGFPKRSSSLFAALSPTRRCDSSSINAGGGGESRGAAGAAAGGRAGGSSIDSRAGAAPNATADAAGGNGFGCSKSTAAQRRFGSGITNAWGAITNDWGAAASAAATPAAAMSSCRSCPVPRDVPRHASSVAPARPHAPAPGGPAGGAAATTAADGGGGSGGDTSSSARGSSLLSQLKSSSAEYRNSWGEASTGSSGAPLSVVAASSIGLAMAAGSNSGRAGGAAGGAASNHLDSPLLLLSFCVLTCRSGEYEADEGAAPVAAVGAAAVGAAAAAAAGHGHDHHHGHHAHLLHHQATSFSGGGSCGRESYAPSPPKPDTAANAAANAAAAAETGGRVVTTAPSSSAAAPSSASAAAAAGGDEEHGSREGAHTLLAVNAAAPPAMRRRGPWALSDYNVTKRVYKGATSAVYRAICRTSGLPVALKVYFMARVPPNTLHMLRREIELHIGLAHRNIIMLYAAFHDQGRLVLVQEWAARGDLYGIHRAMNCRLTETQTTVLLLAPFLDALASLHRRGIVHRDIKPENILYTQSWTLKIADFGVSICLNDERAVTRTGTVDYMAPEVERCPLKRTADENKNNANLAYTAAADIWSVGVLAYEMLVGFPPFVSEGHEQCEPAKSSFTRPSLAAFMAAEANARALSFPSSLSEAARDFIRAALIENPSDRPTAEQLLQHPWLVPAEEQQKLMARQT